MTRETLRSEDPALAKALDTLEAPALPPGFADRVTAAARQRQDALPRSRPGARRRFGWSRGRHLVLGSAALLVAGTAAAAATGLLGRVDLRPVGQFVERVAAAVPGIGRAAEPKPEPEETEAAPEATRSAEAPPAPGPLANPRRERLAQAIAARIDRRIAAAEARGIEVPERLRDPNAQLSPERAAANPKRAALVERVQQIRRARQQGAESGSAPEAEQPASPALDLAQLAADWEGLSWRERLALVRPLERAERRRLYAMLTPEQRAEIDQMRRQRAARARGGENF